MPSSWKSVELDGARYMYGFAPLCTQAYAVYVSDMEKVWMGKYGKEKVFETAESLGIVDFDEEKFVLLINELASLFEAGLVKLVRDSDVTFTVEAKIMGHITWTFELDLAESSEAAAFFKNVLVSEFANHSFLTYKISQLENLIRARDEYTLYLEENYKTVNGSELIDKYRRQHVDASRLLARYDRTVSNSRITEQYKNLVERHHADGKSRAWANAEISFKDETAWSANKGLSLEKSSIEMEVEQDYVEVKQEHVEVKQEQEQTKISSLKKELSPPKRVKTEPGTSPKRKRVGILGRR